MYKVFIQDLGRTAADGGEAQTDIHIRLRLRES
jgi:hypothetical protein